MNAAVSKIFDAIFGALDLFRFWIVLYDYERGVILRLGKYHRTLGPGLHWRMPFRIEELRFVNVRKKTASSWDFTHTLSDGVTVTGSFAAILSVTDAKKVLLDIDDWENAAYSMIRVSISRELERSKNVFDTLSVRENIREAVALGLDGIGVSLDHFGFPDFAKTRSYKLFNGAQR